MDSSHLSFLVLGLEEYSLNPGLEAGLIVSLILLCGLSFFTTLCEVAYREASSTKLRAVFNKPQGRQAMRLIQQKDKVIMCNRLLDVLTTIAIVVISLFVGFVTRNLILAILMASLIAFLVAVVIGEVIPSAIAAQRPERVAVAMSYPMAVIFYLFYPLTIIFWGFSKLVKKMFHLKTKADVSEKELKFLAMDAYKEGSIEKDEHDLVLNSLNFDDKTIDNIMVPLKNVSTVNTAMSLDSIQKVYEETNYSRLPIRDGYNGKFIGLLYQKDFYQMRLKGDRSVKDIVKPALYMDYSTNCSKALKRFQALKKHLALVRRDGEVVGLVTVEDLLEELVGDIEDEYDAQDLEKEKAKKMQERSDKADAQEEDRRKGKFTDTMVLPSLEEALNEEKMDDEDLGKDEKDEFSK